jgi:hypothetical protein
MTLNEDNLQNFKLKNMQLGGTSDNDSKDPETRILSGLTSNRRDGICIGPAGHCGR